MPSIASVSRFRLSTREPGAAAGTEILVNGGRIETVRDGGDAPGTQIEVRSLFYNVPARRKFLRSETTEARNIEHQFFLQALAHPEIGFSLVREGKIALQLPITTSLLERIRDLYGAEFLDDLLEIFARDRGGVHVRGWIGRAGVSRQTRAQQFVFVNGRAIESGILSTALREGYHTALMRGQFPVTFLFVDLDPREVDVNVHPAKREVRFRDPAGVREAVVEAVQRTLESGRIDWRERFRAPAAASTVLPPGPAVTSGGGTASVSSQIAGGTAAVSSQISSAAEPPPPLGKTASSFEIMGRDSARPSTFASAPTPQPDQQFQIIGVLNRLYVLMENSDG
ncbi:MAG: DNA mismatch repair protein MutL, partial [Verrucomicrobia bacterium]